MDTWPTGGSSLVALDAICATLDGPHPEARLIIQCEKNATGRYLVIQITGSRSILSLCEVEVFVRVSNTEENIAFGHDIRQSTYYKPLFNPDKAVDGSTEDP
ncbi:hypothetical protein NP493_728g01041 [Ridgeia piscesae]|uniref:Uncharacterized protein n=1 Tax=Ridgeia piscesae TaxID=27915 RepID=A0AAD9KPX8_RIDPI|nr:hypothetical protein NP493_728g01041 [Ridgeia piscesae]